MKWSMTRMSTKLKACLSVLVKSSFACEGSAIPLGWLWANITAAALKAAFPFVKRSRYENSFK